MSFLSEKNPNGIVVLTCPRQLTLKNSPELKQLFSQWIDAGEYKFVVDLTQTKYVDSSGLGAMVSRIAVCRSNHGDVRIATAEPLIRDLLDVTNLNRILKCFDDVHQACSGF
jgi:anti-sigma B factor antagonist